jgi:hypothetical protein
MRPLAGWRAGEKPLTVSEKLTINLMDRYLSRRNA